MSEIVVEFNPELKDIQEDSLLKFQSFLSDEIKNLPVQNDSISISSKETKAEEQKHLGIPLFEWIIKLLNENPEIIYILIDLLIKISLKIKEKFGSKKVIRLKHEKSQKYLHLPAKQMEIREFFNETGIEER